MLTSVRIVERQHHGLHQGLFSNVLTSADIDGQSACGYDDYDMGERVVIPVRIDYASDARTHLDQEPDGSFVSHSTKASASSSITILAQLMSMLGCLAGLHVNSAQKPQLADNSMLSLSQHSSLLHFLQVPMPSRQCPFKCLHLTAKVTVVPTSVY